MVKPGDDFNSSPTPAEREQFEHMRMRAEELHHRRQFEEAAKLYGQLAKAPGYEAEARYGLGNVLAAARKDWDGAEKLFSDCIKRDGRHTGAMVASGDIALLKGETDRARDWFRVAKDYGSMDAAARLEELDGKTASGSGEANQGVRAQSPSATPRDSDAERPVSPGASWARPAELLKGTVSKFTPRQESRGRGQQPLIVWMFRLEDETQVEIRAFRFRSTISNGDKVEVRGRWNRAGVFVASRAFNESTQSHVVGPVLSQREIILLLVGAVIIIAFVWYTTM